MSGNISEKGFKKIITRALSSIGNFVSKIEKRPISEGKQVCLKIGYMYMFKKYEKFMLIAKNRKIILVAKCSQKVQKKNGFYFSGGEAAQW